MFLSKWISVGRKAALVYRAHGSLVLTSTYLARSITRRLPALIERRRATRRHRPSTAVRPQDGGRLRIAALVTGGIGDHVIAARFFRDLALAIEPFTLDVYSPIARTAGWVFTPLPGFRGIYYDMQLNAARPLYDLTLDLAVLPRATMREEPGEGLGGRAPRAAGIVAAMARFAAGYAFLHDSPVRTDGFLAQLWQARNIARADLPHHAAGIDYTGPRFRLPTQPEVLDILDLRGRPFVSVHNGFEAARVTLGRGSTKCYPHFSDVITLLRAEFPDLRFVQIGTDTSLPIPGVDRSLISQTTLAEAAAIIEAAVLHLDNESGLVHVASCLGTPCCVVFGPTPPDYFGYSGNQNLRPPRCGGCWWTTPHWMDQCPRGFAVPVCVGEQPPAQVAAAAAAVLRQLLPRGRIPLAHPLPRYQHSS
jgi:hypothetical protein